MITIPNKPSVLKDIIRTGIRIWRGTFKAIIPFSTVFAVLTVAYELGLKKLGIQYNIDVNTVFYYSDKTDKFLIMTVVFLVFVFIINAAMVWRMHAIARKEGSSITESLCVGLKKSFPFFMVCAISLGMVLGGTLLFVIPGIALSVSLIFAPYLIIMSKEGIFGSIRESMRLVNGHWWFTATGFFTITLLFLVISLLGGVFVIGLDTVREMMSQMSSSTKDYVGYAIDFVIISIIYPLFNASIMAMLYDIQVKQR